MSTNWLPQDMQHRVGQKLPNPFGLYDMHDNAIEPCSDWYSVDYYRQSPQQDPRGPESGKARVARSHGASYSRHDIEPDQGFCVAAFLGMRIVCEVTD